MVFHLGQDDQVTFIEVSPAQACATRLIDSVALRV